MNPHPKAPMAPAPRSRAALRWTAFTIALVVFFTTYTLAGDMWVRGGFRDDWALCVQFIHEGTLYGGQPFCHHAPVFLYILTFLEQSFGGSALVPITTILNIALNVLIALFVALMVQRETGKPHM